MGSLPLAPPRKPYIYIYTHIHIHNGKSFNKKEGNPALCDNMDEAGDMLLSEINRECKYCMISFIRGI